jgi:hypothetical protein
VLHRSIELGAAQHVLDAQPGWAGPNYDRPMTDGIVRSTDQTKGSERILAATGRTPEDWYARIDEAGGMTIGHTAIAAWVQAQGVDGWWAQSVAIGYGQVRGLRVPGQRSDGTFAVSASKQVAGTPDAVLDALIPLFADVLGMAPTSESRASKRRSARWTFPDRETVGVWTEPGSKPDTVRISAMRERLTGPDRMADAKAELKAVLARV